MIYTNFDDGLGKIGVEGKWAIQDNILIVYADATKMEII